MTKINLIILSALLCLLSCQSVGNKRRATDQYYTSSGVEKFYLSDIPEWLNYSKSGKCVRQTNIRFLDLPRLMEQFSYQYAQALQFQYMLNHLRHEKMQEVRSKYLLLKDEEIVFYDTVDKIQGGIYYFDYSKYKRLHIIWIDQTLRSEELLKRLHKLFKNAEFNEGFPLLVSLCLDDSNLRQFVTKTKLYEGVGVIPFDLFSIFDSEKKHQRKFGLDFSKIFSQDQELHIYLPEGEQPPEEFVGTFKIHHF